MTVVIISYLLYSPEGFRLPYSTSIAGGLIAATGSLVWFGLWSRKEKTRKEL
jgi:hypothetical protein